MAALRATTWVGELDGASERVDYRLVSGEGLSDDVWNGGLPGPSHAVLPAPPVTSADTSRLSGEPEALSPVYQSPSSLHNDRLPVVGGLARSLPACVAAVESVESQVPLLRDSWLAPPVPDAPPSADSGLGLAPCQGWASVRLTSVLPERPRPDSCVAAGALRCADMWRHVMSGWHFLSYVA
jgi:hypothetical protein